MKLRIKFLNRLSILAFDLSEWLEWQCIGKTARDAHRAGLRDHAKASECAAVLSIRLVELGAINPNMLCIQILARCQRQLARLGEAWTARQIQSPRPESCPLKTEN